MILTVNLTNVKAFCPNVSHNDILIGSAYPSWKCQAKVKLSKCHIQILDKFNKLQERPPPVPPSRPYTVTGNRKIAYPQSRVMKNSFPGL